MRYASTMLVALVAIAIGRMVQAFLAAPVSFAASRMHVSQRAGCLSTTRRAASLADYDFEGDLKRRFAEFGGLTAQTEAERLSARNK
jgi:hypothetical protein